MYTRLFFLMEVKIENYGKEKDVPAKETSCTNGVYSCFEIQGK
jgi:hypothetical protein